MGWFQTILLSLICIKADVIGPRVRLPYCLPVVKAMMPLGILKLISRVKSIFFQLRLTTSSTCTKKRKEFNMKVTAILRMKFRNKKQGKRQVGRAMKYWGGIFPPLFLHLISFRRKTSKSFKSVVLSSRKEPLWKVRLWFGWKLTVKYWPFYALGNSLFCNHSGVSHGFSFQPLQSSWSPLVIFLIIP